MSKGFHKQHFTKPNRARSEVEFSIVVPLYNEAERIYRLQDGISQFAAAENFCRTEIILVDDGSLDNTYKKCRQIAKIIQSMNCEWLVNCTVIRAGVNKGKGGALATGVAAACGRWVATIDADMATPMKEFARIERNYNLSNLSSSVVFIGNRNNPDTRRSPLRALLSFSYISLVKKVVGLNLPDTQCSLKIYPLAIARVVFGNLQELGFAHDIEILCRLKAQKCAFITGDVPFESVPGSKVHLVKDTLKMFYDLFRVQTRVAQTPVKDIKVQPMRDPQYATSIVRKVA